MSLKLQIEVSIDGYSVIFRYANPEQGTERILQSDVDIVRDPINNLPAQRHAISGFTEVSFVKYNL